MTIDVETMYHAVMNQDASFEGLFYFGVKTTGIFCRPSCTARKPKAENIIFFGNTREAMLSGYRPCRICRPLEPAGEIPEKIRELLNELFLNSALKFQDSDLKARGIEPSLARRWFQKNYGMTFQAFQRNLRIGAAYEKIRNGEKVIDAAFNDGYESLSGFNAAFKKKYGNSPKKIFLEKNIFLTRIPTPLGTVVVCATDDGICMFEFADNKALDKELNDIKRLFHAEITPGNCNHFNLLKKEMDDYFKGKLRVFTVPLVTAGSEFQKKVWQGLTSIPYGETRSYKELAFQIGNPLAVRAVGTANGANRIAILIPCHRIIGADGGVAGYSGGIWRKKFLLELEKGNILRCN